MGCAEGGVMEPRIQYAKTSDGVSIAYAVFGTGPAIVFPSINFGSLHLYKNGVAVNRITDDLVSRGWSVITYDGRGSGSSDRHTDDWTLESKLGDLEAVVNRAAPDRFAVYGTLMAGPTAISYAVKHPDRVAYLVLNNTFATGSDWFEVIPAPRLSRQTMPDAENEWEFATLTLANALTGYADSRLARRIAEALRTGVTAKGYTAAGNAMEKIDVKDLLAQISAPTIVIHSRTLGTDRVGVVTQRLAPLIPNAQFVETDDVAKVIDEFLRDGGLVPTRPARPAESPKPPTSAPSGTAIILFADIVDSTALTERLGDAAFRTKARDLDTSLRTVIRDHSGTAIEGKLLGDGVLAVFTSARQAIEAALACGVAGSHAGLPLHLGLHAGDVIREEGNVYGGTVNIASRISGLSAPGEVLVSDIVRGLARTSGGVSFEDRGKRRLKGVGEPMRVWAVREAQA